MPKRGGHSHHFGAGWLTDMEFEHHPYSGHHKLYSHDLASGRYDGMRWNKGIELFPPHDQEEAEHNILYRAIGAASQRGPGKSPEVGGKVKKTPMPTGGRAPRPERVPGVKAVAPGNAMQIVPLNKYKPPPLDLGEMANALSTTQGELHQFAKKFKNKEEFATHMQRHSDMAPLTKKHNWGTPKLHRMWKQMVNLDKNQS